MLTETHVTLIKRACVKTHVKTATTKLLIITQVTDPTMYLVYEIKIYYYYYYIYIYIAIPTLKSQKAFIL